MAKKPTKIPKETDTEDVDIADLQNLSVSERSLRLAAAGMEKKFGESGRARQELEDLSQPMLLVPDLAHQYALNALGYRGGRSMVIAGEPGGSKSSLGLTLCEWAIQQGGTADYLDLENALNHDHLGYYLSDPDAFVQHIRQPLHIQDGIEMMRYLNKTYRKLDPERKLPKVIVFDSIGGAPSKHELDEDKEIAQMQVGGSSNYLTVAARAINNEFVRSGTLGVFINHAKKKIFLGFDATVPRSKEEKMTYPGGSGVIYAASYFELLEKGSQTRDTDKHRTGFAMESSILRNRGRVNGRGYGYDVVFGEGLSFERHTMEWLALGATLGMKVKAKRYWCPEIGVTEADKLDAADMYRHIHGSPEIMTRFQQTLDIGGNPFPAKNAHGPTDTEEASQP